MPAADITFVALGERLWPDLRRELEKSGKTLYHLQDKLAVAGLEQGMASGKPSIAMRFDLADGNVLVAEISLELLLTIADAMRGRFGDPRT